MSKYDIITAGTVIQLDRNIKPKKTADELVNKLQNEKGITFNITTLIISKKPGNTGISRDIRTEFTTDLLLSD